MRNCMSYSAALAGASSHRVTTASNLLYQLLLTYWRKRLLWRYEACILSSKHICPTRVNSPCGIIYKTVPQNTNSQVGQEYTEAKPWRRVYYLCLCFVTCSVLWRKVFDLCQIPRSPINKNCLCNQRISLAKPWQTKIQIVKKHDDTSESQLLIPEASTWPATSKWRVGNHYQHIISHKPNPEPFPPRSPTVQR